MLYFFARFSCSYFFRTCVLVSILSYMKYLHESIWKRTIPIETLNTQPSQLASQSANYMDCISIFFLHALNAFFSKCNPIFLCAVCDLPKSAAWLAGWLATATTTKRTSQAILCVIASYQKCNPKPTGKSILTIYCPNLEFSFLFRFCYNCSDSCYHCRVYRIIPTK